MEDKIKTKIKTIGKTAQNLLANNYLVIFESDDDEFSTFGYTVENPKLYEDIKIGDVVYIDKKPFKILNISAELNESLKKEFQFELIIDREFDGENQILLDGESFPEIKQGSEIIIKEF